MVIFSWSQTVQLFSYKYVIQPCGHWRFSHITSSEGVLSSDTFMKPGKGKKTSLTQHSPTLRTPPEPIHAHLDFLHFFAILLIRGNNMTRTRSTDSSPMRSLPSQNQYRVHGKKMHIHIFTYWAGNLWLTFVACSFSSLAHKQTPTRRLPESTASLCLILFRSKEFPTQPSSIVRPRNLVKSHP